MRLLIANHHGALLGGIETYLAALLPHLARDHEILFVHEATITSNPISLPSPTQSLDLSRLGPVVTSQQIRQWKPDVIYFHALHDLDFQSALLEIAPTVAFAHGYYGLCISGSKTWKREPAQPCSKPFDWRCLTYYFPRHCGGSNPLTMWRDYQRQSRQLDLLRRCDAVITHAGQMHREYLAQGISKDRLFVLPHFVEPPISAESLPRNNDAIHLIYIGRFDLLKGGHLLFEALPELEATLKRPILLRMLGSGPAADEWKNLSQKVSSQTIRVEFPGWVDRAQKDASLANSDLLVVPSIWPEPFGQVGLEAAQLGVPGISFDLGGIHAWLKDGINGYCAPANPATSDGLAAAMAKALENPAHYAKLRVGAKEVAAQFTFEKHLLALTNVFSTALQRRQQ